MKTDPKSLYQLQGQSGFLVLVVLVILFLFTYEDTNGQVEIPVFGDSLESGVLGNWVEVSSTIASVSVINNATSEVNMNGTYHIKGIAGNGSFNGNWTLEHSIPLSFENGKTYVIRTANMSRGRVFTPAVNTQSGLYLTIGKGNGISGASLGGYTKPAYINSTDNTDITIRIFETIFTATETTDSVYLNLYQHSFDSYMYIDDITVVEQVAESITITQPLQDQYFTKGDSIVINWTSVGVDSVDVNGVGLINNNTYTISANIVSDIFPIKVSWLVGGIADLSVFDLITVKVVDSTKLEILSASVVNRDVTLRTIASVNLDSLIFYVGLDTNDMQYLGRSQILGLDTTYIFTLPTAFHVSGNYYYKVINDIDTTSIITSTDDIVLLGMPRSELLNTCWYTHSVSKIGTNREHDSGCRWVGNMTIFFHNFMFYTDFPDSIAWQYQTRECTYECKINPICELANCTNDYNDFFVFVTDTLLSITDSVTTVDMSEFKEIAPFTYGNRTYYMDGVNILANDLVNSVDSILVRELVSDEFIDVNPSLSFLRYEIPNLADTLFTDGTSLGRTRALTELENPKLILYQDDSYGFSYLSTPPPVNALTYDIYLASDVIISTRNYFRGINPKILK